MAASVASVAGRNPVRRVAVTCDFLRFRLDGASWASDQTRNLAWLHALLAGCEVWRRAGIELFAVAPPTDMAGFVASLGNDGALREYRLDPEHAWARRYDQARPDLFADLFEGLKAADLVVGFELPPVMKRYLNDHGLAYLNLFIHPLRFLRDLSFGATTNSAAVGVALSLHRVSGAEVDRQVSRFRALFLRRKAVAFQIPEALPVLIGQTEHDSVLIRGGTFFDWRDAAQTLVRQLHGYDDLVFLPHPARRSSQRVIDFLRCELGKNVIETDANSYGVLFSNPGIPQVLTLSSSLGIEAAAMGLTTHFLLAQPHLKFSVEGVDVNVGGPYGHGLLASAFWSQVLGLAVAAEPEFSSPSKGGFSLGENFMRNSLESFAYGPLQTGLARPTARKKVVPASAFTPTRRRELRSALDGLDKCLDEPAAFAFAQAAGVQVEFIDAPLRLDEHRQVKINGSSGSAYLGSGFHAPESWGVWTCELRSQVRFCIDATAVEAGARLDVALTLKVYDRLLPKAPVLRICHAGALLGYAFFRIGQAPSHTLRFSFRCTEPICVVDLELSDIVAPSMAGGSEDYRFLGIGLTEVAMTCGSMADPSASMAENCGLMPDSVPMARATAVAPTLWGVGPIERAANVRAARW